MKRKDVFGIFAIIVILGAVSPSLFCEIVETEENAVENAPIAEGTSRDSAEHFYSILVDENTAEETLEILSYSVLKAEDSRSLCRDEDRDYDDKGNCKLNFVEFISQEYRIFVFGSWVYGTQMFARYRTKSPDFLEEYVFVQYIKGCVYLTYFEHNAWVTRYNIYRHYLGGYAKYKHDTWVFDKSNEELIYFAEPGRPTHYWYYWNEVPDSFEKDTRHIYGKEKPSVPELYVQDHSPQAFFREDREYGVSARNVSLQFMMCLYRAKDVPRGLPRNRIELPTPVACFPWQSSFVYNPDRRGFESYKTITCPNAAENTDEDVEK